MANRNIMPTSEKGIKLDLDSFTWYLSCSKYAIYTFLWKTCSV